MTRATRWSALLALVAGAAAVAALVGTSGGNAAPTAKKKVVIGWAFDSTGNMKPFDTPALAAAKIRVAQINAQKKGTVQFQIKTCDTESNNPAKAKSCALSLLGGGADVIFTTCDVDYATPVVQEALKRGKLAIAPCIGTDQMGPKRFGKQGVRAFSFGNVAQDEGSAMAQYAWSRGWKTAGLATNTLLVYFKNVVQAFEARWKQLGGKIVAKESYQSLGGSNVQNAVSRLNNVKADVIVTSTAGAFGALSTLITGLRTLGNKTPVLNSWAGDGNYWLPKRPKVTNYYFVTFASIFGDDPVPAVNKLAKQLKAGTGGFITGSAAIDGVATAIRRSRGSTRGVVLAAQLERFRRVPTLSGLVSFSKSLHTVFGRQYRVISINDNKAHRVGTVTAKVVPKI